MIKELKLKHSVKIVCIICSKNQLKNQLPDFLRFIS
ncbi:MAG: hypothetical protein MRERC_4c110 [Mycoplasmataceae bacterium RC_NB112A]|nr:MAG: hypothetical protein MRERC_4c110 [Mycoplasmataceae bacterium RC_NB112A]